MNNDFELIDGPRTISIHPLGFKRLFENTLVDKYFDINKVDILKIKKSEIEKSIIDRTKWFKKEGADKYSKDIKKKFYIFAHVALDVLDVRITYSPEASLYFIENNGVLAVKNKWVYKTLYSRSLIYKTSPLRIPDLQFIIRQREIQNIEVLTGYFKSIGEDETSILFNFPIKLASAEEIAKKFDFELKEQNDFMGKDDLNEQYELSINEFKSGGIVVYEEKTCS